MCQRRQRAGLCQTNVTVDNGTGTSVFDTQVQKTRFRSHTEMFVPVNNDFLTIIYKQNNNVNEIMSGHSH